MRRLIAAACLGVLAGMAVPAEAEPGDHAGYILGWEGDEADFEWRRGVGRWQLQPDAPLLEGDTLRVLSPSAELHVLIGTQELRLRQDDTAGENGFVVESEGLPPTILRWVWRVVSELSGTGHRDHPVELGVDLLTRGGEVAVASYEPVAMALLPRDGLPLAAGHRPVHLRWSGGRPPFRVELRRLDGDRAGPLVSVHPLRVRRATFSVSLEPGVHALRISGAGGTAAERRIEVVPPERLPARPRRAGSGAPRLSTALLDAVWLARQDGGRWAFEAFQRLATLAPCSAGAAEMADDLSREGAAWLQESAEDRVGRPAAAAGEPRS